MSIAKCQCWKCKATWQTTWHDPDNQKPAHPWVDYVYGKAPCPYCGHPYYSVEKTDDQ